MRWPGRKPTLRSLSWRGVCVATALLSAAGCTTLEVTADTNPSLTVAACHSYAWATEFRAAHEDSAAFANPVNENRLRNEIAANLRDKGLQPAVDRSIADCTVGYSIGVRTVVEGNVNPGWGWGWGYGWGWRRGGYVGAWDYPSVYREGRVAVNIYDAKSHQPIWHASVNEDVTQLTGDAANAKIHAAVAAIFARYP